MNEFLNNLIAPEYRQIVVSAVLLAITLSVLGLIYRGWKSLFKPYLERTLNQKFVEWYKDNYLVVNFSVGVTVFFLFIYSVLYSLEN